MFWIHLISLILYFANCTDSKFKIIERKLKMHTDMSVEYNDLLTHRISISDT